MGLPVQAQSIAEARANSQPTQVRQSNDLLNNVIRVTKPLNGLTKIINYIERTANVSFVYRKELIAPYNKVGINSIDDITIRELLETAMQDVPLTFVATDKYIIITDPQSVKNSQEVVSGVVRDANDNDPLPGVNVMIKGSNIGTTTNKEGTYRVVLKSLQDTLIFSFIGYQTQEIPVNGRTNIDVMMETSTSKLSEVVVTGVLERDIETYTGSQRTINTEELRRAGGNDNIIKALQNIDPSFVIVENLSQGSDPNTLPEVQLRGTSAFPAEETGVNAELKGNYLKNPNQPLFILDGFETSATTVFDLNVDRVKSVTILKDASAKALYGSRAANGVVVIETKQLNASEPIITYNSEFFIEGADLSSYNLTNAEEKLEAERIEGFYESDKLEDQIALQQLYNTRKKRIAEGLDTDWMSKPLRTAFGQNHSLAIELGTEDLKLLGRLRFRNDGGVMKGSNRKNLAGNVKASYRIDNFLLRNNLQVNKNNSTNSPYGRFSEYSQMNPYWRAVNPDGSIPYYSETGLYSTGLSIYSSGASYNYAEKKFTNPLYNSTLNTLNNSSYLNFTNNFYAQWDISEQLRTTARIGISSKTSEANEFYPAAHTMFESYALDQRDREGMYQLNDGSSNTINADLNIKYSDTVGKHFYLANIGGNIRQDKYSELVHTVEGFPSERLNDPTFGRAYALDSRPRGVDGINRELGVLFIGSYSYDERYLSDLTLRTNASSQFGADKRWANFWSFGLGWNLHNEAFFEAVTFIDRLKIRGSLGSTGNQNFNTNASISTYTYYLQNFYDGFVGSYTNNMSNPGLQWETKFDYNAGLDAEVGNLTLRVDYYESYTENLVTDLSIPSSTGFTTVKENVGRIKNSGIEADIAYLVWAGTDGFLSLNAGVATNKNKIINLSEAMRNYNAQIEEQAGELGNSTPLVEYVDGGSMNSIWAVPSLGIDPATGNEIYVKKNGNTTFEYDPSDRVVAGNSMPDYRGNFGLNGEYKGFGLGVIMRFFGGGQMYNKTLVNKVENIDINDNVDRRVLTGRWTHPGQYALFKRLGTYYAADTDGDGVQEGQLRRRTRPTTRFVQNHSQLDIAAINLYYDFNAPFLDRIGLRRLRLGVHMSDVATFSTVRIERGTNYPYARRVSFNISATF
ncbi:MAG TPA: SusC/RagA family TonB-linked outer membrane protein [Fodinibius sp.]|nr:SusC/RagA family TonB-linked outer membrane protein [Fodinibius sp.]